MIYGPGNAAGATVREAETGELLKHVMRIDTETATVTRCCSPVRMNWSGDEVDTYDERFEFIHAIQGAETRPALFICYGRKAP